MDEVQRASTLGVRLVPATCAADGWVADDILGNVPVPATFAPTLNFDATVGAVGDGGLELMGRPWNAHAAFVCCASVTYSPFKSNRDRRVDNRLIATTDRAGIDVWDVGKSDRRAAVVMDAMEAAVAVLLVSVTFRERRVD